MEPGKKVPQHKLHRYERGFSVFVVSWVSDDGKPQHKFFNDEKEALIDLDLQRFNYSHHEAVMTQHLSSWDDVFPDGEFWTVKIKVDGEKEKQCRGIFADIEDAKAFAKDREDERSKIVTIGLEL